MKILVTGHQGYVGPVLGWHLASTQPAWTFHGADIGFFRSILTDASSGDFGYSKSIQKDIRDICVDDLVGFDAVVQLAAVSNDPIGKMFAEATVEINSDATIELAQLARAAGCKRFVFASSCSIYGAANQAPRKEADQLDPLTEYAKSKVIAEKGLEELVDTNFSVVALRFSTACGASPRLRLDLVMNDFVANGVYHGQISVMSDGTPWRPLIHVEDMARAIEWSIISDLNGFTAVNVGSDDWTWQIGQLANDVAGVLGEKTEVCINIDKPADKRSYRVNFEKFKTLAPYHQPTKDFEVAIHELRDMIRSLNIDGDSFRESDLFRLNVLRNLVIEGVIDKDLRCLSR